MGMLDDLRKVLFSERETGRLTQIGQELFDRTHTGRTACPTFTPCDQPHRFFKKDVVF
jgi:hypothetical protein